MTKFKASIKLLFYLNSWHIIEFCCMYFPIFTKLCFPFEVYDTLYFAGIKGTYTFHIYKITNTTFSTKLY